MAKKKFKNLNEIIQIREELRRQNGKVVFTNGCFDLLHSGHVHIFREANKLGDVLVVAVNEDESVRKIKGGSRPIFPLEERLEVLEAIEDIDYLISFSEETPQRVIAALLPDVLVKGGDWAPEEVVGKREVEDAGGRVVIIPYLEGRSSSEIIGRIIQSAGNEK
ncbi:MAG: D-glycero-beta-D-manno-heptose 1-phosphate adenylyltransferase [Candidatus Aminicenantes bacterium]